MAEKIFLAASGGGHLRQLRQLTPLWARSHHVVTERTALGESLTEPGSASFVPHFAFGQRRREGWARFLAAGLANGWVSLRLVLRHRPRVIVSTGAGSVFAFMLLAKLFGAHVIYIESLARVRAPSRIGRMIKPVADHVIVQWPALKTIWPDAHLCQPLTTVPAPDPQGDDIFVTVGTVMPFDRLIAAVDGLAGAGQLDGRVVAQVGDSAYQAHSITTFAACDYGEIQAYLGRSRVAVVHGGTGSILSALEQGCAVVAMPRRADLGEHYDDHQREIVEAFAEQGLIDIAHGAEDLAPAIARARARPRQAVITDPTILMQAIDTSLGIGFADPGR